MRRPRNSWTRGLRDRPDVPHFLSLLGEVDRKLGNPAASLELNRKALQVDPSMTPAHYYLALVFSVSPPRLRAERAARARRRRPDALG